MADMDLNRIEHYQSWLTGLKDRIRVSQLKAAVRVNTELMLVYWQLGRGIVEKQQEAGWGDALIEQLSRDLSAAFPEMKGFSRTNLFYVRKWYLFYNRERKSVLQLVGQLSQVPPLNSEQELIPQLVGLIPWGHNREIVTKCSDVREALFYVSETIRHGWSRAVLQHQLESGLYSSPVCGRCCSPNPSSAAHCSLDQEKNLEPAEVHYPGSYSCKQILASLAFTDVSPVHNDHDHKPERVDYQVPFAPFYPLSGVIAPLPSLLHRLHTL